MSLLFHNKNDLIIHTGSEFESGSGWKWSPGGTNAFSCRDQSLAGSEWDSGSPQSGSELDSDEMGSAFSCRKIYTCTQ